MITIHYTGAFEKETPQSDPAQSLGGFVSATRVPNNRLNNIFDDITAYQIANELLVEHKALVIKNNFEDIYRPSVGVFYDPDKEFMIELAFVELNTAGAMERIMTSKDAPYIGEFMRCNQVSIDSFDNMLGLPEMPPNTYMGIWIRRTLEPKAPAESLKDFDVTQVDKKRNFKLIIT